jgi:hypothetical protein
VKRHLGCRGRVSVVSANWPKVGSARKVKTHRYLFDGWG